MTMPLEGLRILAVSQFGAGPYGTMMLADLGAEIIKIEDPASGGDISRSMGPGHQEDDSLYFQAFNRNKRSLTLNLGAPKGKDIFHRLVKISHGVFNNLRGDVPARLGLTYGALREHNPAIVCCSLNAYGTSGLQATLPGYDPLLQASEGYMSVTGDPDGAPVKCGVSVIDFAGGLTGALGLMTGIFGAQKTGIGCDVNVTLRDTAVSMLNYLAIWNLNLNLEPKQYAQSSHSILVPGQTFRTRDGYLAIFCAKEKFWEQLCEAIARPDLLCDPRFSNFDERLKHKDILIPLLEHVLAAKTNAEWLSLFIGKVPCAPVRSVGETLSDPALAASEMIVEIEHPEFGTIREVGCPIKVSDYTPEYRPGPELGQDTEAILGNYLGIAPEEIAKLRGEGVL